MLGVLTSAVCLSGYIYAANRWLKLGLSASPLFSVSLIGLLLFGFSLSGFLRPGSLFLMYAGYIMAMAPMLDVAKKKLAGEAVPVSSKMFFTFLFLFFASFGLNYGMKFTIMDDYVYWGIIGKYLFQNHHLPNSETVIIPRHLAYTPGAGLFHYFFYTLMGKYNAAVSYFAQSILLISSLFVVISKDYYKKSLILLAVLVALMTIFSGSVFTKLQVDYLLSIYFFSLLWIYFGQDIPNWKTVVSISTPVCFLFLIKEIGLALGMMVLILVFFDLLFHPDLTKTQKVKFTAFVAANTCVLFFLKKLWGAHCLEMGFMQFNSAVNPETIKNALAIFSDENVRNGVFLFLKDIIIGPADRFNLPYLVWYGFVVFCWIKLLKAFPLKTRNRFLRVISISLVFFIFYLLMLYFMQIIIFGVGKRSDHTIGLERYLNILFSQCVFFSVMFYANRFFFLKGVSLRAVIIFLSVVALVVGLSRVRNQLKREEDHIQAEIIARQIKSHINTDEAFKIALVPGTGDNKLGMKLLYYSMPSKINYTRFPAKNRDRFLTALANFDYVLFHHPGQRVIDWASPIVDKEMKKQGFYKIEKTAGKVVRLKELFETGLAGK